MTPEQRWTTAGTGPVVAVFMCRRCGRKNCGEVRRDASGRLFVRNERDLPLPRDLEGGRRSPGIDGEIVLLDSAADWRHARPWCVKCGRRLRVPDNAPGRLASRVTPPVVRISCEWEEPRRTK